MASRESCLESEQAWHSPLAVCGFRCALEGCALEGARELGVTEIVLEVVLGAFVVPGVICTSGSFVIVSKMRILFTVS